MHCSIYWSVIEFFVSVFVMMSRNYASVGSKIIPEKEDRSFIDLNTEKLCSHVCVNYLIEGMIRQWYFLQIYVNLTRQLLSRFIFIIKAKLEGIGGINLSVINYRWRRPKNFAWFRVSTMAFWAAVGKKKRTGRFRSRSWWLAVLARIPIGQYFMPL